MSPIRYRRLFAGIFTFASFGFLLETMFEKNGPLVEIAFGILLAALGVGWLAWEFLGRHAPKS